MQVTIRRRVVVAEHRETGGVARRRIEEKRDRVGLRDVAFADVARGVGARRVEVAQRHEAQRRGCGAIPQHALAHQLAGAIRADRLEGSLLGDRNRARHTINRAGAGEDDVTDIAVAHGGEQFCGAAHIVAIVERRVLVRFPHIGKGREMHDRGRPVAVQCGAQERTIGEISDHQLAPFHRFGVATRKVVIGDRCKARFAQGLAGMAADISGAAGDQNGGRRDSRLSGARIARRGTWAIIRRAANAAPRFSNDFLGAFKPRRP